MPKFRTAKYSIFRACERFGLLPPGVKQSWDENHVLCKCDLLAYEMVRSTESVAE
jgi:hypothetical protein